MENSRIQKNMVRILVVLAGIFFLVGVYLIVDQLQQPSLDDTSVAAAADRLNVLFKESAGGNTFAVGDKFTVKITPTISSSQTQDVTVAELVITFNKNILKANSPQENTDYLALNKTADNQQGVVTTDVAKIGIGSFPNSVELITIEFEVINIPKAQTKIKVDTKSTLGVNNVLGEGSYGELVVALVYASGNSGTTTSPTTTTPTTTKPSTPTTTKKKKKTTTPTTTTTPSTTSSMPSDSSDNTPVDEGDDYVAYDPFTNTGDDVPIVDEQPVTPPFGTQAEDTQSKTESDSVVAQETSSDAQTFDIVETLRSVGLDKNKVAYGLIGGSLLMAVTAAYFYFKDSPKALVEKPEEISQI